MKLRNHIAFALNISAVAIFLFSVEACTKDISVTPLPYSTKPVIECMLKPGDPIKLSLNSSVAYFDALVYNKDLFIRNATVIISSSFGTETLQIDSAENLFTCEYEYFYKSQNNVQPNTTYTLNLTVAGKTYSAQTTTNQTKAAITAVSYTSIFSDIYGEHEGVIVDYNDIPVEQNFYRYQMIRTIDSTTTYGETRIYSLCTHGSFFYVKETGRAVYKDKNQDGLPQEIVVEPAYKHKANDSGYVFIQTIDKNAADFYDQLDRQKLSQFNPFVEPVFLKPLQFPDAIGVFGSYALSDSVLFVYPE